MVCAKSFSGRKDECPYTHLREFAENCSLFSIPGMNQNTLRWKLFAFSLKGNAKIWYNWTVVRVGGDWIQLKDEFGLFFFPVSKEEMLMQHFVYGLNPESEHFLNLASEGSVMYKTVSEAKTVPERVLNSTQYTDVFDDPP
ncbi:uncharacterized protein LOC120674763 [Panicum virgatum]|uniref:uncharacterized protein LOC120674763 n=1 Tax=Panicum virgatum TaxID=38727 RepID=UPI0019D63D00|nr:uncharacterized protein LOC120674763 [Panicum virgatum]